MPVVITNTKRASMDTVDALGGFGVATVHEAQGRTGLLDRRIRPIYRPIQAAGNALTCIVPPGDNWSIHVAVEHAQPGDLLLVSPSSPCEDGYFGELLATSLAAHGVRGLVMDGGVRDVAALTDMQFPVWSRVISAQGTVKEQLGDIQVPIVCGGVVVRPGDVVIADDDGIVVTPRQEAETVVGMARHRVEHEDEMRKRLASGELSLDIHGTRDKLAQSGLRYVEVTHE